MLSVGNVRMANNKCTPNTNIIVFKNVLRTFEAEILKIFKNIHPRPQNLDVRTKIKGALPRIVRPELYLVILNDERNFSESQHKEHI